MATAIHRYGYVSVISFTTLKQHVIHRTLFEPYYSNSFHLLPILSFGGGIPG